MTVSKSRSESQGHGYKFRERENEFDFRQGFKPLLASAPGKPRDTARAKTGKAVSAPDITAMVLILIFAGLIGVGMTVASSWMSSIQYDINRVVRATEETYAEIEKLTVKIEKGTGIGVIEHRATSELGMIYPTADQVVYIEEEPPSINDFAQYIKENAYQLW